MASLSGVRALVTGGTSGLGRAMASALAAAGASVVVTGRSEERARAAAAELGGDVAGLAMDVRSVDAVVSGVEASWSRLGGIDVLVNNAAIGMRTVTPRFLDEPQPFWEVEPDGFRAVLDT